MLLIDTEYSVYQFCSKVCFIVTIILIRGAMNGIFQIGNDRCDNIAKLECLVQLVILF